VKLTPLSLSVLLACTSFGMAQPAPQPAAARGWQPSQRTDPAQTYTFTRFTLVGRFASAPNEKIGDRPALTIDCIPGTAPHPKGRYLAADLLVGSEVKIVYVEPEEIHGMSYYPKVDVRYRADDAKGWERDQWSAGADKASASVPGAVLKRILRAHTLAITVDGRQGAQLLMRFDIPDPTPVEEACNMDER
jgi:hypothetical protein